MNPRRYLSFSDHLKQQFGVRVHKISVDAGFGCPNRSGGRSGSGCLFCDPRGSGAVGLDRRLSVAAQLEQGKEVMVRKYKARRFLAYFQPFSNTFAPVERLAALYDEALAVEGVVGLAIGTRPDCLDAAVLDLLAGYHRRTCFWLELGLQTIHDPTLAALRRGHDMAAFRRAFAAAKSRGLNVCVHLILGLPGEDRAMMLASAREMGRLGVDGVKLHLLHILDGTPLAESWRTGAVPVLTQEEYVALVVDVLEVLPPTLLIHRLTGDGPRDTLLAPLWSLRKWEVLNAIDAELERRDTRQGAQWQE